MKHARRRKLALALVFGLIAVPAQATSGPDRNLPGTNPPTADAASIRPVGDDHAHNAATTPPVSVGDDHFRDPVATPRPTVRLDGSVGIGATGVQTAFNRPPVASASDGFDWTDAGIGFGTGTGLVLMAGASLFATRRIRRPGHPVL